MKYYRVLGGGSEGFEFGIHKGNFLGSFGESGLGAAIEKLKTDAPKWVADIAKSTGIQRPFVEFRVVPGEFVEMAKQAGEDNEMDFLALEEFEEVVGGVGLDDDGFIASAMIKCPTKLTGILSAIDGKPLDKEEINDLPNGSISSAAARIPFRNIFELVKQSAKASYAEEEFADSIGYVEDISGLDFEQDIIESFEGTFYSYSKMTGGGVAVLKLKDQEAFKENLKVFAENIALEVEAVEGGELNAKEYKDFMVYSFTQPPYIGPSFSWCQAEDDFYIALDSRSITSQLRKRGKTRSRLIDEKEFAKMFDFGDSKGWGKPMFVSHVDVATAIQVLLPIGQAAFGSQSIPGFDFGFADVPSVEVLTKGVGPNMICFYRTKDGIRMVERSTIPGGSSIATSGVAIGMLLPAVQQVRQAARRATAMNNGRQLMLALHNYAEAKGSLPPASSTDKNGKPLLSWRVHILPYLEEKALYEKFHLDEPWDSPHNKELIKDMPAVFENPQANPGRGKTNFLGISGVAGMFGKVKGLKFSQFTDGTSNCIGVVDTNDDFAVDWTAPNDLDPDKVDDLKGALEGNWPGDLILVFQADGSAHALSDMTNEKLRELMNIKDGKGDISEAPLPFRK